MSPSVETPRLRIAVLGPGGIGSTFAYRLADAGHDVTVVARGARLQRLRRDGAIVTTAGERAEVRVAAELDPVVAWDLVLVTVLTAQVEALLPALASSAARSIMFMFNTFRPLDDLRARVGRQRTAFGFPAVVAGLDDGALSSNVLGGRASTVVSDPGWAEVFGAAGIPSTVQPDMQGWLRTHAAVIVPLVLAAHTAHDTGHGIGRRDAARYARALREGIRLVRHLGDPVTPGSMALLGRLPLPVLTGLVWALTRVPVFIRMSAVAPRSEPALLIDEMNSVAPQGAPALLAVRPV